MTTNTGHRRHHDGVTQTDETASFIVAYYFLPLERPLSIDDKAIIRAGGKPPIHERGYEDDYLSIDWDDDRGLVGCRISCRIHQIPCDAIEMGQVAAHLAAIAAFPHTERVDESLRPSATLTMDDGTQTVVDDQHDDSSTPPMATVTVAEVALRVPDDSATAVNAGFDVAVAFVADLQRVYSAVARQPMPTMTRFRLPWLLPYAIQTVAPDQAEPQWPTGDDIRYLLPQALDVRRFMPMPDDENPARWTTNDLGRAMTPVLEDPFRHVHETWRNASVALQQGDLVVAAILLGVTCEQYIRALLLCLIWEDDTAPQSASELMYKKNGNTKNTSDLLTELRPRLSVSPSSDGTATSNARSVLDLRNRVLHRTHEPEVTEVQAAADACEEFAAWTRDRLLARLERYPATCELILTPDVVDASQAVQLNAVFTTTLRPTRPHENIRNYQIEIDRHLPGNEAMRECKARPDPSVGWVLQSLTYPNGAIRWFGLDESNWLAFLAKPLDGLREPHLQLLNESVEQAQVKSDEFGHQPTIVIRWKDADPEPQAAMPQLHSWFKICPLDRAERYASCPTPYIAAS